MKQIQLPLSARDIAILHAGETVTLYGEAVIARDAAHKRLYAMLQTGADLPFSLSGACIYYAGPCPAAPGEVIGPCGPTTSGRVDAYTPALIEAGLSAMIGKGARAPEVVHAMRGRAVYFAATGGAAILLSSHIVAAEVIAFADLEAEAVRRVTLAGMPVIVAIDAQGNSALWPIA
ncbi:MAG: fumarate hydratase C-terminal domain-containing protein [Clostridiales bacterium]|jgi:fumarate hydratase subunit beta|nr:fumarate hydratase C-terminal domain-containing protein [Clostridiales bacterium]